MLKSRIRIIILIILAALAAVSVIQGCKNAMEYSQDFQWDAAKALAMGYDPYEESLSPSREFLAFGYEEYYKQMEANQFPSLLMLLFPYTLLPPLAARYVWLVSNLIFTAAIIYLLRLTLFKETDSFHFAALGLLMLAGTPWRNQIGVGQHTLFSLTFFLLSVYVYGRRKEGKDIPNTLLCSVLLSISFFKYTLTAPLALYYVYKRRFDILAVAASIHVIMTAWAAHHLGDSFINMIRKPLEVASHLTGEGSMDIGLVVSELTPSHPGAPMVVSALIMIMLAAMAFISGRKHSPSGIKGDDAGIISLLTLWALIFTYHRTYDFFVMIIPYCALLGADDGSGRDRPAVALWMKVFYTATVLFIFFGLRIFSEGRPAMAVAALLYYTFLIAFTFNKRNR